MSQGARTSTRTQGWVWLSGLPVPSGGPGRWRAAVEAARIRATLGVNLATQLVACRVSREGVVRLEFRGSGWERSLGPIEQSIRAAIEQSLRRSITRLEIVSVLAASVPDLGARPEADRLPAEPRTRWQRIAARIGARRDRLRGS